MSRKVLIISPYFPPCNAADMHRVRMSLPYLKQFGWEAEIVTVNPEYSDLTKDELLLQSIPSMFKIHCVNALDKRWTSKFGLGSIALRSLWFYLKRGNQILSEKRFDLIYFSTTQFPVCILGRYWKKKFKVPYVIDMQDPWHSDYYADKPKHLRPPKYWFAYRLNKYLEPIAMKHVDGLVAVSEKYITDLKFRYPQLKNIITTTIPFGAFAKDLTIAHANKEQFKDLLSTNHVNIVYIGRGGADMHSALNVFFEALKTGVRGDPALFKILKLYFIGTSYAPFGQGTNTVLPIAAEYGLDDAVIEITDRISFYHTLVTLQKADALFIPGSDDPKYSASKIYPYLLTRKPLLTLLNSKSPALAILSEYGAENAFSYDATADVKQKVIDFLQNVSAGNLIEQHYNQRAIEKYSAENATRQQCLLFDNIIC